jgi:outer membrane protein TolC
MIGGGYQLMPRSVGALTGSIGLTWPGAPWARGGLDAKKAEAVADVDAARARELAVITAVRLSVQQSYVRAEAAEARASLLDTTVVPQSMQVLDASRVAYQSNRADIAGLVQQEHDVLEARLDYFRALAALEEAQADLEYAVGDDRPLASRGSMEGK